MTEIFTLPVFNIEGKEIDTIQLDNTVFDGSINTAVISQMVNAYLANQRKGLAVTKTRGEVSGGGRKPWKQKGTGRARHGSSRSPIWRHGGVTFGPQKRDFSYSISKKIKSLALKSSLNAKVKENNFIVLDNFNINTPKTKEAVRIFSNLKIKARENKGHKVLLLVNTIDNNLRHALDNLEFLKFNVAKDTQAYEIIIANKIIVTRDALNQLVFRLSPPRVERLKK